MTTEPEVYSGLTEVFRDALNRDDILLRSDLTSKDVPGWDSFKHIEIIMATEERFGIRMTTHDLDGLRTVGDLVRVVIRRSA